MSRPQTTNERRRNQSETDEGTCVRAARRMKNLPSSWDDVRREPPKGLPPMHPWLLKQVGRPWDSVYSDICKYLKIYSNWGILRLVAQDVTVKDGHLYDSKDSPISYSNSGYGYITYVCPETGILKRLPEQKRLKRKKCSLFNPIWVDDTHFAVDTKAGPYLCEFAEFTGSLVTTKYSFGPYTRIEYNDAHDALVGHSVSRSTAYTYYGKSVFVVTKRQLTRKDYNKYLEKPK